MFHQTNQIIHNILRYESQARKLRQPYFNLLRVFFLDDKISFYTFDIKLPFLI